MNLKKIVKQTQNDLLLNDLKKYYKTTLPDESFNPNNNLDKMLKIITGESKISLRIIDWFTTNYAKKYFTKYNLGENKRFVVYNEYKLKLKAYSKKRFDPFCRYEKTMFPYDGTRYIETTIGQLNFFRWSIENKIVDYVEEHYDEIEHDMNTRNSASKRKEMMLQAINNKNLNTNANNSTENLSTGPKNKTRKKREELSVSATKSVRKENIEIIMKFN